MGNEKRKLLKIQGFVLLLPILFSSLIAHYSSSLNEEQATMNSRFLELLRAEGTVSDGRLEFIEMSLMQSQLFEKLNDNDRSKFLSDFQNINKRSADKYQDYRKDLENYAIDHKKANEKMAKYSFYISIFTPLNFISVAVAILLSLYLFIREGNADLVEESYTEKNEPGKRGTK